MTDSTETILQRYIQMYEMCHEQLKAANVDLRSAHRELAKLREHAKAREIRIRELMDEVSMLREKRVLKPVDHDVPIYQCEECHRAMSQREAEDTGGICSDPVCAGSLIEMERRH